MGIISADAAYEVTMDKKREHMQSDLKKIEDLIEGAISREEFYITIDGFLSKEAIKELKDLGYKIEEHQGDMFNSDYTNVIWSKNGD